VEAALLIVARLYKASANDATSRFAM